MFCTYWTAVFSKWANKKYTSAHMLQKVFLDKVLSVAISRQNIPSFRCFRTQILPCNLLGRAQ